MNNRNISTKSPCWPDLSDNTFCILSKNAFLAEFLQKCMSPYKQQQDVAIIALAKNKKDHIMCLLSNIHYNLRSFFELCFDLAGRLEIPVDFWPTSILTAVNSDPE